MSLSSEFCTCPNKDCDMHPTNHDKGCDLCMKDNIENDEIPNCLFGKFVDDVNAIDDFSFVNFAKIVLEKEGK